MDLLLGLLNRLLAQIEAIPVPAAIAGLALVALVPLMSDRVFALTVFGLFVLPLTQFAPAGAANGIRGLTLVLAGMRMVTTQRFGTAQLMSGLGGWTRFLVASTMVVILSSVWSLNPMDSLVAGIGLISVIAVFWSASPDGRTARWAAERVIATIVVATVIMAPISNSWVSGRLRGVMVNANGLAVFLVMAALLSLGARRYAFGSFALCAVLLFLTGSRSGALALGCGLVVLALAQWRRRNVTPRGVLAVITTSAVLVVVMLTVPFERLPWRTKDTRSEVWETSFGLVQEHMLLGLGGGAFPTESGSSYLRILAELGIVGTAICLLALVTGLRPRTLEGSSVAVLGAMAVHMAFEGWFLVGGSAIFLFTIALSVSASGERSAGVPPRSSPAHRRATVADVPVAPGARRS